MFFIKIIFNENTKFIAESQNENSCKNKNANDQKVLPNINKVWRIFPVYSHYFHGVKLR